MVTRMIGYNTGLGSGHYLRQEVMQPKFAHPPRNRLTVFDPPPPHTLCTETLPPSKGLVIIYGRGGERGQK